MAGTGAVDPAKRDAVWKQTVDRVKQNVISPGLWRAMERSVAVAWEDSLFVIGFAAMDGQMAGLVNARDNQLAIERALREVTGLQDLRVRVIDGTQAQDWEQAQERDAATLAHQQQAVQRRYTEATAFSSWDAVYDQVSRLWASFEYRALTVGRGRYLDAALDIVVTAMNGGLYPAEGKADEVTERGLTRVLDRIASMTGSDAVIVGYLLVQKRKTA
jgi:hypothetical protein